MKRVVSFLLVLVLFSISSCVLSAGSYPFAETYELNYSEEEVKSAIKKLKNEHPEFKPQKMTINNRGSHDLLDEINGGDSHWSHFYFYFKEDEKTFLTYTRMSIKNKTTFAFVRVLQGHDLANKSYTINDDFSRVENKEHIKRFEKCILSKVKYYLENPFE
jgi:hypothetical protein